MPFSFHVLISARSPRDEPVLPVGSHVYKTTGTTLSGNCQRVWGGGCPGAAHPFLPCHLDGELVQVSRLVFRGAGLSERLLGRCALSLPGEGQRRRRGATRGNRPPAGARPSSLACCEPPLRARSARRSPSPGRLHRDRTPNARCRPHGHPAAPQREAAGSRGKRAKPAGRRELGRRARAQVLTFPLRPPPPAPLRLASELTARPSGPSAGPQHRCHGRDSGGQDGSPSSPVSPCLLAPPPPPPPDASAPAKRSRLTFEDRALPRSPPSLSLRLSCHLFPAGL